MHNNKKLKNTYHVIVALFLPHYLRECCEILSNPKLVHLINWCLPIWPRALHIFYDKKILLSNFQNKNVWKQAWKTSDFEVHYCYCNNEKLSYTYWWHCIFYTSPIFKSINYHHPAWLSELTNPWDLVFFILCCSKWRPAAVAHDSSLPDSGFHWFNIICQLSGKYLKLESKPRWFEKVVRGCNK